MLPLLIGAFVLDKILLWAFALYYIFRIVCKVFDLVILHSKPFATYIFKHTIGIMLALIVVGVAGFLCFGIGGEVVSGDPLAAREQAFAQKVYSQGQIDSMSYMVGVNVGNCAKVVFADGFKQIDPIITQRAMSQKIRYGNGYDVSFNSTADSLSWELGLLYGTLLRSNHCITGMGEFNQDRFKQGYDDAIRSDGKLWFIPVDAMMDNWKDLRQQYVAKQNLLEGKAFLEKNATREGVNVSKSGLQYVIDDPGEGRRLRSSSTVNVKYKGMTLDGHVFDAHDNMQFKLNRLIKGWTEGLCMLSEGGKIVMFIPSELAYGDKSINGIEPNSVTIYEVEILKVVRR
jgi:FKBP-type peptidyl-prolyl cis-trans isomerase